MQADAHGRPIDKSYLEVGLPAFLRDDIDGYVKGEREGARLLDCLWGELYGSINSALSGGAITEEQANYLRGKYLFDKEAETDD